MNDTLVLDMNYRPVGFCDWQDAVRLWYKDRAIIIKEDESGKVLRSSSFELGLPRVIRVRNAWVKRKRQSVPFSRRNVAVRDNSECQYCGKVLQTHQYTLDHILPRSKGGISSWLNLVIACVRCNKKKAGLTLIESGMRLLRAPFEPKPDDPKYNFKLHIKHVRNEWKDYAAYLYWNVVLDE